LVAKEIIQKRKKKKKKRNNSEYENIEMKKEVGVSKGK